MIPIPNRDDIGEPTSKGKLPRTRIRVCAALSWILLVSCETLIQHIWLRPLHICRVDIYRVQVEDRE